MKPCGILPESPLPTSYFWDGQIKNETLNPYAMVPKEIWSGKGLDKLFKIVLPPLALLSYTSCILISSLSVTCVYSYTGGVWHQPTIVNT